MRPILLFLASAAAFVQNVDIRCESFRSEDLSNKMSIYRCLESGNVIVHSEFVSPSIPELINDEPGWFEFHISDVKRRPHALKPISSCLSTVDGSGGMKVVSGMDAVYFSSALTLKFPLLRFYFLQYGITPGFGFRGRITKLTEYGCVTEPGKNVQIVQSYEEFELIGWLLRRLTFDSSGEVAYDPWKPLPQTVFSEQNETVMCVTDPKLLKCRL